MASGIVVRHVLGFHQCLQVRRVTVDGHAQIRHGVGRIERRKGTREGGNDHLPALDDRILEPGFGSSQAKVQNGMFRERG